MNTPGNPEGRNLAELIGEMTEEEKRSAFRELAKSLLDPSADDVSTICDNEGNVLGYFEPALHHLHSRAEIADWNDSENAEIDTESKERFMEGGLTVGEFLERTMEQQDSSHK